MKEIKLTVSKLTATCLQRMIVEEIEHQEEWSRDDIFNGFNDNVKTRQKVINEMTELANELEEQGVHKYVK